MESNQTNQSNQSNQILSEVLNTYYFDILDLWKKLCLEHTALFDITCEEYNLLLSNDVDTMEALLDKKESIIKRISDLDLLRKHLINKLNALVIKNSYENGENVQTVSDLIKIFKQYEKGKGENFLLRYNQLLISIIEKIQLQNRKNQIFLNKAILSIKEIREGLLGKKSYNTYNSMGVTSNMNSIK
ncbi:MAG: flagellar export chaperone FlgN [Oligoflexia bacterium]|nr:flagellar export chaperone FlgN [Oligoflexia bacterium]